MKFYLYLALFFLPTTSWSTTLDKDGWLAFGELRGYFEPCGCDPDADLGGVERIGGFLERERALAKSLHLYNLGNNIPVEYKVHAYKIPFILRAMESFAVDAYLVNELEYRHFSDSKDRLPNLPLVLSNQKSRSARFALSIEKAKQQIFGFVSPSKLAGLEAANDALIQQWRANGKKDKERVLLFSGSQEELEFFVRARFFDLIISANPHSLDTIVALQEKENESLLQRPVSGAQVLVAPLGGQGVIRGGVLQYQQAPLLKDLFKTESSGEIGFRKTSIVTWLDKNYMGLTKKLDLLSADYAKAGRDLYAIKETQKKAALKNSKYVGVEACSGCHDQAVKIWKQSKHAGAMATLKKVNQDKNPECVACHVVGYDAEGGFASMKSSPHLANVQCENCHGPRKDHIDHPTKKGDLVDAKKVCVECHQGNHSPNFEYKKYWDLIKHDGK